MGQAESFDDATEALRKFGVDCHEQSNTAVIELNNPPMNTLNIDMARALSEAIDAVEQHEIPVTVVRSGVDNVFMAGGDIKRYHAASPEGLVEIVRAYRKAFQRIHSASTLSIACLDGLALGGGAELALACDLRLVTERAQLGFPEILIGAFPAATGTQFLTRIVGYPVALELMLTGRRVDAAEMLRLGLANRVCQDSQELAQATEEMSEKIGSQPARPREWIKRCARLAFDNDLEAGFAEEDEGTAAASVDPVFRDRIARFLTGTRF